MTAIVTPLRPPATPDTPPFDYAAHARILVLDLGYTPSDVPALCPLATGETQAALAEAMAKVTGESVRLILEATGR